MLLDAVAEAVDQLRLVLLLLGGVEAVEQLFHLHLVPSLQFFDRPRDGVGEPVQPLSFVLQPTVVVAQDRQLVRAVQHVRDHVEAQAQVAQQQDLLQAVYLFLLVVAVAVVTDPGRWQ